MFAKVFASLWQGSMVGKADAQLVFVFLLAHCSGDGTVEVTQEHVAALTGVPLERVTEAIAVLEAPDSRSRSQDEGGRRLVRLDAHRDWGWRVVNFGHYRSMRNEEQRREENRERMRKTRAVPSPVADGEQRTCAHCAQVCADVCRGAPPCAHSRRQKSEKSTAPTLRSGAAAALAGELATLSAEPLCPYSQPVQGGQWWTPETVLVDRWVASYPAVDVRADLRRMREWTEASPKRKRTPRGIMAGAVSWLARTQNGAGRRGFAGRPQSNHRAESDAEYRRANPALFAVTDGGENGK